MCPPVIWGRALDGIMALRGYRILILNNIEDLSDKHVLSGNLFFQIIRVTTDNNNEISIRNPSFFRFSSSFELYP